MTVFSFSDADMLVLIASTLLLFFSQYLLYMTIIALHFLFNRLLGTCYYVLGATIPILARGTYLQILPKFYLGSGSIDIFHYSSTFNFTYILYLPHYYLLVSTMFTYFSNFYGHFSNFKCIYIPI
uniref:Uncharacterized protein n=1 Tax=Cacopsylla melanoneura TaxID=428564 RepID=A0A8D9BGC3_9HEMI